jgi:hypothetical protein
MSVWCSGRGGFARGKGHRFEPRNCGASRLYAKKCATGTGGLLTGGALLYKKVFFCLFSVFKC